MVPSSAAGYDVPVAGLDEVSARSVLAAMQDRLARDPASAFGVVVNATVDDVRAAFLQLTKQYHPVRFGRMAQDIQKLANEVFLALRAAHEALVRSALRQSGPIPMGRTPAPTGSQPLPVASLPPPAASTGVPLQSTRITQQLPVRPSRPLVQDSGERPPVSPRVMTPAAGVKISPRVMTPAMGVKIAPLRPPAPPPVARPLSPVRQTGGNPVLTSRDEAVVVDLLQRQQWDQARSVLHQLSARDPSSKRVRALMCYARGREAQLERRVDDARVELQEALDLDPDLQLAKTALTELFTRRK
jgi:hypothetical protein